VLIGGEIREAPAREPAPARSRWCAIYRSDAFPSVLIVDSGSKLVRLRALHVRACIAAAYFADPEASNRILRGHLSSLPGSDADLSWGPMSHALGAAVPSLRERHLRS